MDYAGRTLWTTVLACPAELEAEGDRVFALHAQWMQATHHRDGEKALLQYTVTKGPHPERDDAVVFSITEVYQSPAGWEDHARQAHEEWADWPAFQSFVAACEGQWGVLGDVQHSLW
jgi:hypothetical protein